MERTGYRLPGIPSLGLTELGPIQKFSCWMYFTLSYTPLFFSTYQGGSMRTRGARALSVRGEGRGGIPRTEEASCSTSRSGQVAVVAVTGAHCAEAPLRSPTHQLGGDMLGKAHRRNAVGADHQQGDEDVDEGQPVGEVRPVGRGLHQPGKLTPRPPLDETGFPGLSCSPQFSPPHRN